MVGVNRKQLLRLRDSLPATLRAGLVGSAAPRVYNQYCDLMTISAL